MKSGLSEKIKERILFPGFNRERENSNII